MKHLTEEEKALWPEYSGYIPPEQEIFPDVPEDNSELYTTLFAPDPSTGVPRSDIAIMLSKDTSPVVADYIQKTLQRSNPSIQILGETEEDADLALAGVKSRSESIQEYAARLAELAKPVKK